MQFWSLHFLKCLWILPMTSMKVTIWRKSKNSDIKCFSMETVDFLWFTKLLLASNFPKVMCRSPLMSLISNNNANDGQVWKITVRKKVSLHYLQITTADVIAAPSILASNCLRLSSNVVILQKYNLYNWLFMFFRNIDVF